VNSGLVLGLGLLLAVLGLCMRFVRVSDASAPWARGIIALLVIPFAHAPRSWIPWGLAIALLGASQLTGVVIVTIVCAGLALLLLILGAVLLFWSPRFMRPASSIRTAMPPKGPS
jgi:hypothetical protein